MPRIGMEPLRRKALVDAALRTIGSHGSLDVTMSEIAREAGVSAALAHHYFGSKQQLVIATIQSLLARLRADLVAALQDTSDARKRLSAVIRVSFHADQFDAETVAAWLAFYVEAQRSDAVRRLLIIYTRRLRSNLKHALAQLCPADDAARIAEGVAAMIDGLYIRQSLNASPLGGQAPIRLTEDYLDMQLKPFLKDTQTP